MELQFHGLGGSVIDTWHVELEPRCRQQGVLVVHDVRFFMRSQVRVVTGDAGIWDVFGLIRYGIWILERVSGLGVLARTQGVPVQGCDPRICRRTRVVRPRAARS